MNNKNTFIRFCFLHHSNTCLKWTLHIFLSSISMVASPFFSRHRCRPSLFILSAGHYLCHAQPHLVVIVVLTAEMGRWLFYLLSLIISMANAYLNQEKIKNMLSSFVDLISSFSRYMLDSKSGKGWVGERGRMEEREREAEV